MEGLVHCVPQKIPVMEQTKVWIVRGFEGIKPLEMLLDTLLEGTETTPELLNYYNVFASEEDAERWAETLETIEGTKTEIIESTLTVQTGYSYPNRPEYGDAAGMTFKDFTLRIR